MRKQITVAIFAAMIGGLVVLGGAKAFGYLGDHSASLFTPAFNGQVHLANLNGQSDPVNMNFTVAAGKTLPVVVNIQSSARVSSRGMSPEGGFDMQDVPEPFRRFFGPRMFGQPNPQHGDEGDVQMGTGSGVVISPDGYIVTNNHVVAGADELLVTLNDKRSFKAKVIGTDPSTDLGLIKIEASGLPFVNFSNSDAVQVGEWVLAVGNPFNLTSTVTAGIVSAKGRDIHILQDQAPIESFIQTDAAINPGNSGGALVNLNGDLIGINAAIASPTGSYSGYGFAIPSNIVAKVVDDLKKYGVAQRGYLGVVIREVNGELAKEKDLPVTQGVYVDSLAENSSAGAAGIRKGDVITKIDNQPVDASSDVLEAVGRHRPGDKLDVTVQRNGSEKVFSVTLKNKQGNTDVVKKSEVSGALTALGAEFQTLGEKEAKKLELPGGVKMIHLGNGKLANQTDIHEGFIVTKVDGKPVRSVEELTAALSGKQGGVMLEGVYPDRPGAYYYAFGM
ncbi:MAG TPA: Do family serine endopeptidase [Saprospiraceae bacterium]|nr:Do family serine endopeptidase [Saprospiraceae bacterium]